MAALEKLRELDMYPKTRDEFRVRTSQMATRHATTVAAPPCDVLTLNSSLVLGYMSSSRSFSRAAMLRLAARRLAAGCAVTQRQLAQDPTDNTNALYGMPSK